MALKETLNGFSQTKETCCKVSNENKTHKYSAKKSAWKLAMLLYIFKM